jgi:site-specific recombinase XerD
MTTRKIGVTHMALYRGWLQGMPLRDVADLYLETGLDLRRAKTTLTWVQDTLRRAALRHGRHGEARLLRLRVNTGRELAAPADLPSIDDFREDVDPTGFYSFDELMTQYLERYPAAGNAKAQKRSRLIQRQINTLNWLEALLVTEPVPADPVEAWLDENIAKRLVNAAIFTIGDLIKRMNERGYRWYNTVNGLGERTAKRLLQWVQEYKDSLGELPRFVTVLPKNLKALDKSRSPVILSGPATNPLAPQIVPLEAMLLPLRGTIVGASNQPREAAHIRADNDREAVEEWLRSGSGSPATLRSYKKEAERLVLWAMIERGRTLAQMEPDDCASYRDWLCALGRLSADGWPFRIPQDQWMSPRHTKRHSPAWRPFEGALSAKSVLYALTVIKTMFRWLVDVRYLDFNPWRVISKPRPLPGDAPDTEFVRALGKDQWDLLVACAAEMDDPAAGARAHLLLKLDLVTGMRLAELTGAVYGRVYTMPLKNGRGMRWMLKVLGKGAKWRSVPLTDEVVVLMRADLRMRGLPDDPQAVKDDTPIIARLDGGAMSVSGMAKLVKGLFQLAEARLVKEDRPTEARAFANASTHWIRHTTGSMLANSGVPASLIQQLLGHASIATTSIYTTTSEDQLWQAVSDKL